MSIKGSKSTLEQIAERAPQDLLPSEFMRARRPELFSDSAVVGELRLPREVFEYHLDTLTKRKQETEFEHFARRLAEKEICPNLLPQTGPTGGGDSKVDAETYPVSDSISLRWYEGAAREAAQERWAFAFSAKEKWRAKVQSDVEKIAGTNRDYKLIYFVTNQFVRDKVRAEVEDQLTKKHKIHVRILDRTWIVRCVFDNRRFRLAVESLGLSGYDEETRKVAGPRDTMRQGELDDLEQQIADPDRYQGVEYQLAEDCLRAALLARGLELPRVEVEGRFQRAERVAEKAGHQQQRLRVTYNRAWTAFWWYDDFAELNRLYDQIETLAVGSHQATDLELLTNAWGLINTAVNRGRLDAAAAKLDARTNTLKAELERLAGDDKRPNNALLARTRRLLVDLPAALDDQRLLARLLEELKGVVTTAEGLAAYPLKSITNLLREMGDVLADSTGYDELFEIIVKVTERRASEGEAGRALLGRGYQKLRKHRTYDAIRLLGRAQQKLAMREYREELVAALLGCGLAYESAGLLWAARANVLAAANQAFSEYWERGRITLQAFTCLRKLAWLELQLGRVPTVLAWIEIATAVAQQKMLKGERWEAFIQERQAQDQVLAILLLKTGLRELEWLDFLPGVLNALSLEYSRMALLYALGHEAHLRSDGSIPEGEPPEAVRDFFWQLLNQPAGEDVPDRVELVSGDTATLRSFVLGCEVIVEAASDPSSIYIAESLLAALEALMATSLDARAVPHASEIHISISPSDSVEGLPETRFDDGDLVQSVAVEHAPDILRRISDDQRAYRSWLQELVIQVAFRITFVENLDSYVKQLFGEEGGLGRAFDHAEPTIPVTNILGESPKFRLSDWEEKAQGERFRLNRTIPWSHGLWRAEEKTEIDLRQCRPGEGEPPPELLDVSRLKHRDRRVLSLINVPLWDRANWQGAIYIVLPELDHPPYLGLGFRDADAAQAIFRGLLDKLGMIDRDEQLRVSIVTGIDKNNPSHYMVVIGSNFTAGKHGSQFVMVSKPCRMEPPDTRNLDLFLSRYERLGKYILLPAHYVDEASLPTPYWDLMIGKQELHVRPAWQIGEHDPDVCAIDEDSDPIIPGGVENAPVLRALSRFERRGRRKADGKTTPDDVVAFMKPYAEKLGTTDITVITAFLEYLSKDVPKGHWPCYCGSKKKLRQCHLKELLEAREGNSTNEAKETLARLRRP